MAYKLSQVLAVYNLYIIIIYQQMKVLCVCVCVQARRWYSYFYG